MADKNPKKSKKKILFLFLRVLVSAVLVGYFLHTLSVEEGSLSAAMKKFIQAFSHASFAWLIPAFLLHIVGFSLLSLRWRMLLKPQGVTAKFTQLFQYYFMAAFFNALMPSTIGGDAVRVVESKKLTGRTSTSVMVVIIERLTGMMALGLIAAAALIIKIFRGSERKEITWGFAAAVLGGFLLLVLLAHPRIAPPILNLLRKILPGKIQSFLDKSYQAAAAYYRRPAALFSALGLSVVFQVTVVIYYYFISRALGQQPEPVDFLLKAPILVFLLMTVPAVNGIGVRVYVFSSLMKFPGAVALSAEFIDLGIKYIYAICGGLVFLFKHRTVSLTPSSLSSPPDDQEPGNRENDKQKI